MKGSDSMKIMKNYRLSPITIDQLQLLRPVWPGCTETEIVEEAIRALYHQTFCQQFERN